MSDYNQTGQNVGNQVNAGRDVIISPLLEGVGTAVSGVLRWFKEVITDTKPDHRRETYQFDLLQHHRRLEEIEQEKLKLRSRKFESECLAQEELNRLKKEELKLKAEGLRWEKIIAREKMALIRDSHKANLEYRKREIQLKEDKHYLPTQISRKDIFDILEKEDGRLVVIPSPPEILRGDIECFKSLAAKTKAQFKTTIEKYYGNYYGGDGSKSPIGYQNILAEPIEESQASVIGKMISPIPTLILHSQVIHHEVIIYLTITCPIIHKDSARTSLEDGSSRVEEETTIEAKQQTFSLSEWNWMEMRRRLEVEGKNSEDNDQIMLNIISAIHVIVMLCFCDVYCLNLNPNHSLQLLEFLKDEEKKLPSGFETWIEPVKNFLLEAQRKSLEEFNNIQQLQEPRYISQSHMTKSELTDLVPALAVFGGAGLMGLFLMLGNPPSETLTENRSNSRQPDIGTVQGADPNRSGVGLFASDGEPDVSEMNLLGEIPNGTSVTIEETSRDGKWHKISTEDGKSGWIWADFIY